MQLKTLKTSESFLDLRMKQPVAIDFEYKVSIFTTKYEKINSVVDFPVVNLIRASIKAVIHI